MLQKASSRFWFHDVRAALAQCNVSQSFVTDRRFSSIIDLATQLYMY